VEIPQPTAKINAEMKNAGMMECRMDGAFKMLSDCVQFKGTKKAEKYLKNYI
jgi:hypothetical protein